MTTPDEWEQQVQTMMDRAVEWSNNNPDKVAKVQFNYPPTIAVIAAISDAIDQKFVSCNDAGLEMIKAMWPWGDEREPTVIMVKIALEGRK
jgi:hypothetical protein